MAPTMFDVPGHDRDAMIDWLPTSLTDEQAIEANLTDGLAGITQVRYTEVPLDTLRVELDTLAYDQWAAADEYTPTPADDAIAFVATLG